MWPVAARRDVHFGQLVDPPQHRLGDHRLQRQGQRLTAALVGQPRVGPVRTQLARRLSGASGRADGVARGRGRASSAPCAARSRPPPSSATPEPVHAPAAPSATDAAICRPVTMPPAARTGTDLPIASIASMTSGMSTSVVTSPQCPPASVPWATIRSTPALTCLMACSFAPTNAATGIPVCLPHSPM